MLQNSDVGSEDDLDLDTMTTGVGLNEDDQPNA